MFTETNVIYVYTREQAIDDGVLVDANAGEIGEVTRNHFKIPVAMTAGLHDLIRRAVENERFGNDWLGMWHDVCFMARLKMRRAVESVVFFSVIITGAGDCEVQRLKVILGASGPNDPNPCLTFLLENED